MRANRDDPAKGGPHSVGARNNEAGPRLSELHTWFLNEGRIHATLEFGIGQANGHDHHSFSSLNSLFLSVHLINGPFGQSHSHLSRLPSTNELGRDC